MKIVYSAIFVATLVTSCSKAPTTPEVTLKTEYISSCNAEVAKTNTNASAERIGGFCTCFYEKARLRFSAQELFDGLNGGAGPRIEKDLNSELAACKSRM